MQAPPRKDGRSSPSRQSCHRSGIDPRRCCRGHLAWRGLRLRSRTAPSQGPSAGTGAIMIGCSRPGRAVNPMQNSERVRLRCSAGCRHTFSCSCGSTSGTPNVSIHLTYKNCGLASQCGGKTDQRPRDRCVAAISVSGATNIAVHTGVDGAPPLHRCCVAVHGGGRIQTAA